MKTKDIVTLVILGLCIATTAAAFIPSTVESLGKKRAAAVKLDQARQAEHARRVALAEDIRRKRDERVEKARALSRQHNDEANKFASAYATGVIDGYKSEGFADWQGSRYFINPLLWVTMPGPNKINCIEYMSHHHRNKGGSGLITLHDMASGAKLGSYSAWGGVKLN